MKTTIVDEDEFDDLVYEKVHEPVEAALKRVMQRLDREGAFEATNARENVHLGVICHHWDLGELLGPYTDLNPASVCAKYSEDVKAYQNARNKLDNPEDEQARLSLVRTLLRTDMAASQSKDKYYLLSLGCAKNTVDSESMAQVLQQSGMRGVGDPGAAEVLIVKHLRLHQRGQGRIG